MVYDQLEVKSLSDICQIFCNWFADLSDCGAICLKAGDFLETFPLFTQFDKSVQTKTTNQEK